MLRDDVAKVLLDETTIQERVAQLGRQIANDYQRQDLLLLCLLKGGVVFLSDLMRHIDIPHEVEFMAISSYGAATETSGVVRILMDLDRPIQDRNVLIVEDIVDSGYTLAHILKVLSTRGPRSLKVCTLLNKPERRRAHVELDYVGFDIPNEFVVGYGLDFNQRYRNLPFIGVLKPEIYERSR